MLSLHTFLRHYRVPPHKGASIVHSRHHACIFCVETPLRGRSGGHAGAAPTVSLGRLRAEWVISLGWIVRK